jgi:hypothetical protein
MDRALGWFFRVWVVLAAAISLWALPSMPLRASEKNTQVIADAVYLKPQRLVEGGARATSECVLLRARLAGSDFRLRSGR